jgi:hypothetical protein
VGWIFFFISPFPTFLLLLNPFSGTRNNRRLKMAGGHGELNNEMHYSLKILMVV